MSNDSPAAILYDAEGNPVSVVLVNGEYGVLVVDNESRSWQREVVQELRIIRSCLARIVESDEHEGIPEQEENR